MGTSPQTLRCLAAFSAGLVLWMGAPADVLADPPPDAGTGTPANSPGDPQTAAPGENFLSSLKQAFKQDFDHEVIRGHFEVGSPPETHRYYCLVDPKTGKREPNGVSGQPATRADGMTGIKASAVSVYTCSSAEEQGILVTSGYVLTGRANVASEPAAPTRAAAQAPKESTAPAAPEGLPAKDGLPVKIDVAGVKLGMSVDEVRAVLRAKRFADYYESTDTLGHSEPGGIRPVGSGRFVNTISVWTAPPDAGGDSTGQGQESCEVMFTPVPGKERAMGIIHSVMYSAADRIRESTLQSALAKKYGGFPASSDVPASPTWRFQSGGEVKVGDSCNRRGILGGADGSSALKAANAARSNLALKTTPDEFRLQIDRCGVAVVTEDHATASGGTREERLVTSFTVTAYSPSLAFAGATTAAQLMQTASDTVRPPRPKEPPVPDL